MIEFGVLFHTGIVRGKNEFLKARVRAAYSLNLSLLTNLVLVLRSFGYDMKSVRFTEDTIPTIFVKQCYANPKRISSLMETLNRKQVCINDNRVIFGANYWTFTS